MNFTKYLYLPELTARYFSMPRNIEIRRLHLTTQTFGKSALSNRFSRKTWAKKDDRLLKSLPSKVAGTHQKKKKHWHNISLELQPTSTTRHQGPSAGVLRRARHLNAVLYEYITSILSSGEVAPELLDYGFHVLKVETSLDFSVLTVHWQGTASVQDEKIQQLLLECGPQLRQALIKLRVMGQVPRIQFNKDLTSAHLEQVQQLLTIADMGPDFVPTDLGDDMKTRDDEQKLSFQDAVTKAGQIMERQDYDNDAVVDTSGAREMFVSTTTTEVKKVQSANELCDEFADLKMQSDAYDLDRSELEAKIVQIKNKRGSRGKGDFEEKFTAGAIKANQPQIKDIKKVLRQSLLSQTVDARKAKHKDALLSPRTIDAVAERDNLQVTQHSDEVDEK